MKVPGFTAESSLYGMSRHCNGRRAEDQESIGLHPAQIPIENIIFPFPVVVFPAINASFVQIDCYICDPTGLVIVTGRNFAANDMVQVEVGELAPGFRSCTKDNLATQVNTNADGEFTAWVQCDCGKGSSLVNASDRHGNFATGIVNYTC